MRGTTHLLFAILFGVLFLNYLPFSGLLGKYLFALFLVIGATFPDLDRKSEWLKHRGFLHAIYIPAVVALFAVLLFKPAYGFAVGFLAHVISDAMTPMGWAPLAPFKARISGPIKTGGVIELFIAGLLAFLIISRIIF